MKSETFYSFVKEHFSITRPTPAAVAPLARDKDLAFSPVFKNCDASARQDVLSSLQACSKLCDKVPSWADIDSILPPNPDLVEQATPEVIARYRAHTILPTMDKVPHVLDLTSGLGVDGWAMMTERDTQITMNDLSPEHLEACQSNIAKLGFSQNLAAAFSLDAIDAVSHLQNQKKIFDAVLIDPQRRHTPESGGQMAHDEP